jgi:hypothetical protein
MSKNQQIADLFKNSILNSALEISPKIYRIFSMSLERNIEVTCRLKLKDYNNLEMGLGLQASEHIREHREIMRIPVATGFNGMDLIDFKEDVSKTVIKETCWNIAKTFFPDNFKFRQEKNFQNLMLMWQILLNSYYKDAYNYDMVNAFPESDLTQPMFASENIYNNIKSINLKKYYHDNRLYMQTVYDLIAKEAIFEMSFDEVAWAYNNVLARKMIIVEPISQMPYQLILPIIDYVNHSSIDANILVEPVFETERSTSFLSIKASRDIREGEQLFFDYGPMYNKKFMNMYGFYDDQNPIQESDFLFITSSENLYGLLQFTNEDIISEFYNKIASNVNLKSQIMTKNEISMDMFYPTFNLMLYNNKFENKLVKFLRIVYLENDQVENAINYDFNQMYSLENDKKVYSMIHVILNKHLSFVKDIKHSECIEALGTIDSAEKYKTKCMYKLENEEKILLEKNLKFLNNKLRNLL